MFVRRSRVGAEQLILPRGQVCFVHLAGGLAVDIWTRFLHLAEVSEKDGQQRDLVQGGILLTRPERMAM
jgi:hypothetical protein